MIKIIKEGSKGFCRCEECGLRYQEREWAEKCQAWCEEHKSCNLEITKHAIENG